MRLSRTHSARIYLLCLVPLSLVSTLWASPVQLPPGQSLPPFPPPGSPSPAPPPGTDPNPEEFSFGVRLGLIFIAQAASASALCVGGLLASVAYHAVRNGMLPPTSRSRFLNTHVDIYFLNLLIFDFVQAIGGIMDIKWAIMSNVVPGPYCSSQGILKNIGDVGVALFTLAIAIHTSLVILWDWKASRSSMWISGLVVSSVWVFIALENGISWALHHKNETTGEVYIGNTGYWCWITADFPKERIAFEYFWMWFAAFINLLLYVPLFFALRGNLVTGPGFRFAWRSISTKDAWSTTITTSGDTSAPAQIITDGIESFNTTSSNQRIARQMLWYPPSYTLIVFPIALVRWLAFQGTQVAFAWTCLAGILFGLSGVVNVVLYMWTRPTLLRTRKRPSGRNQLVSGRGMRRPENDLSPSPQAITFSTAGSSSLRVQRRKRGMQRRDSDLALTGRLSLGPPNGSSRPSTSTSSSTHLDPIGHPSSKSVTSHERFDSQDTWDGPDDTVMRKAHNAAAAEDSDDEDDGFEGEQNDRVVDGEEGDPEDVISIDQNTYRTSFSHHGSTRSTGLTFAPSLDDESLTHHVPLPRIRTIHPPPTLNVPHPSRLSFNSNRTYSNSSIPLVNPLSIPLPQSPLSPHTSGPLSPHLQSPVSLSSPSPLSVHSSNNPFGRLHTHPISSSLPTTALPSVRRTYSTSTGPRRIAPPIQLPPSLIRAGSFSSPSFTAGVPRLGTVTAASILDSHTSEYAVPSPTSTHLRGGGAWSGSGTGTASSGSGYGVNGSASVLSVPGRMSLDRREVAQDSDDERIEMGRRRGASLSVLSRY